jgi:hypothetical protein
MKPDTIRGHARLWRQLTAEPGLNLILHLPQPRRLIGFPDCPVVVQACRPRRCRKPAAIGAPPSWQAVAKAALTRNGTR